MYREIAPMPVKVRRTPGMVCKSSKMTREPSRDTVFACGTYVPNPYEDKPQGYIPAYRQKTEEEIQAEIAAIARYPTHNLPTRMLKKEYLEHFGIKVGVSEEDGETPETVYFPRFSDKQELMGYKVRLLDPKKMWAVGTSKDAQPFGWAQALAGDGKTIYITEGEFDAVAMYQIIRESVKRKPEYADWKPAVISVPDGGGEFGEASDQVCLSSSQELAKRGPNHGSRRSRQEDHRASLEGFPRG